MTNLGDFRNQYNKAAKKGWIPFFQQAGAQFGFTTEQLMGIASRETNMANIKGDLVKGVYQGYGIMQIDIKSYPDFISTGDWDDPEKNIVKGAEVLDEKRQFIRSHVGSKRTIGKGKSAVTYTGVSLTDLGLLRTATAAYNSGEWAYCEVSTSGDPDRRTTGRDYSTDVQNRAEAFARLLAAPPNTRKPAGASKRPA